MQRTHFPQHRGPSATTMGNDSNKHKQPPKLDTQQTIINKQTKKKEEEATAARSSATRERCEKQIPNWNERNAPSNWMPKRQMVYGVFVSWLCINGPYICRTNGLFGNHSALSYDVTYTAHTQSITPLHCTTICQEDASRHTTFFYHPW